MNSITIEVVLKPSPELAALLQCVFSQVAAAPSVSASASAIPAQTFQTLSPSVQKSLAPLSPAELAQANPTLTAAPTSNPYAAALTTSQATGPVTAAPAAATAPTGPMAAAMTPPPAPAVANAAPAAPIAPTAGRGYTLEELSLAGSALMDAGVDARGLLTQFGVQSLAELPREQYGALAAAFRAAGAKI